MDNARPCPRHTHATVSIVRRFVWTGGFWITAACGVPEGAEPDKGTPCCAPSAQGQRCNPGYAHTRQSAHGRHNSWHIRDFEKNLWTTKYANVTFNNNHPVVEVYGGHLVLTTSNLSQVLISSDNEKQIRH